MQEKLIYIRAKIAKKLEMNLKAYQETLQIFIENPQHNSLNLEKLHIGRDSQSLYSIRHNEKCRFILCPLKTSTEHQVWVVTDILENHEYQKLKPLRLDEADIHAIESAIAPESSKKDEMPKVKFAVANEVEYVNQQFIWLDQAQQGLKTTSLPLLISGAPGSGKTSALLTIIKHNILPWIESLENNINNSDNTDDADDSNDINSTGVGPLNILIVAQSERLIEQVRKEWEQMCEMEFKDLNINPNWVTFKTPEELYNESHIGQTVTFCGEPEFISWYQSYAATHNRLQRDKSTLLPLDRDSIVTVYQELYTMSGYSSLVDYQDQVTNKLSLFTDLVLRNALWQVYEAYRIYLQKQQSVDLAFEPITLNQQYTMIGVDETQDLSRMQLRSLVQSQAGLQKDMVFCVGDHQRLFGSETTLPFIRSLYWESVHKDITTHKVLQATYRCPESIVRVANASLQLKYYAIGGSRVVDKNELAYIMPNTSEREVGQVRWLDDKDALDSVIKANKDNADFVVITSPEYMKQAIALFGQERVFTAKQMKGLQAKEVLLYHFFEQAGFRAANKDMPKDLILEQDALTITKESQGSIRHSTLFNELFVACTRAESTLIFYQPAAHSIQSITNPLKQVVLSLKPHTNPAQQESVISSKEEWLARAKLLREHGQEIQAKAIEARFVIVPDKCQVEAESAPLPMESSKDHNVEDIDISSSASLASPAPEVLIEPKVTKSDKKPIKKVLKPSVEESLEHILDALVAGDVSQVDALFNFKFDKLEAYKRLTPEQQIAQNLPAVVLMDYFKRHNLTVMAPPAPLITALTTYLGRVSAWKNPNEKQQGWQDTFMSLLYYRSAVTPLPLALAIRRALSKDSAQQKFMETFMQQRREKFNDALVKGKVHIVPNLVRLGLLDTPDEKDFTPLHIATHRNDTKLMEALIDVGAMIDKNNKKGETALFFAVNNANKRSVITLLKARPNVNYKLVESGTSPLIQAALKGSLDIVKLLIKEGADVNQTMAEGFTPLVAATKAGYLDIVQELLSAGAHINQLTTKGNSALLTALNDWNEEIIYYLIKKGADVNQVSNNGFSPIHLAAESVDLELIETLVAAGANINTKSNTADGLTPLCLAAELDLDLTQLLISLGANINQTAANNNTPLSFAIINGNYEIVNYLLSLEHCQIIPLQISPKELSEIVSDSEDDVSSTSRAENLIKNKIVDSEGKIEVSLHELATIFGRKNIQQLFEDKMKSSVSTHSNYRFYSSKEESFTTEIQLEDTAQVPRKKA